MGFLNLLNNVNNLGIKSKLITVTLRYFIFIIRTLTFYSYIYIYILYTTHFKALNCSLDLAINNLWI